MSRIALAITIALIATLGIALMAIVGSALRWLGRAVW